MFKNLNEQDKKKLYSLLGLVVVCVIVLIVMSEIPGDKNLDDGEGNTQISGNETGLSKIVVDNDLEVRLKQILSQIEGAGDVDVMVTFEASEEIQPAYNSNSTTETTEEKDAQGGERTVTTSSENKTIITSGSSDPIIIKTTEPQIKGVIVVASGANDPKVKQDLYNAVQVALQISGHQVEIYTK